jgi:hypothetical protein
MSSYVISDSKQCKQQWPTEAIAFIKYLKIRQRKQPTDPSPETSSINLIWEINEAIIYK